MDSSQNRRSSSLPSVHDCRQTEIVVLRKMQSIGMRLMVVLVVVLSTSTTAISTSWLAIYRGGFRFYDYFKWTIPSNSKYQVNLHALLGFASISLFLPLLVACRILLFGHKLEFLSQRLLRFFFIATFAICVLKSYLTSTEHRPKKHQRDYRMHLILSVPILCFMTVYLVVMAARAIKLYRTEEDEARSYVLVNWVLTALSGPLLLDYLERILCLGGVISTVSGILSHALVEMEEDGDEDQGGKNASSDAVDEMLREGRVAQAGLILQVVLFAVLVVVAFTEHDIRFHTDLITYEMYHRDFLKIAQEVEKDMQIQRMQELLKELPPTEANVKDQEDNGFWTRATKILRSLQDQPSKVLQVIDAFPLTLFLRGWGKGLETLIPTLDQSSVASGESTEQSHLHLGPGGATTDEEGFQISRVVSNDYSPDGPRSGHQSRHPSQVIQSSLEDFKSMDDFSMDFESADADSSRIPNMSDSDPEEYHETKHSQQTK